MTSKSAELSLLDRAMDIVERLSIEDQDALMMHLLDKLADSAPPLESLPSGEDDDWALRGPQLAFMQKHHQAIMEAIERDDDEFLLGLAESKEFKQLFGDMGWDEAFDRYEETWINSA